MAPCLCLILELSNFGITWVITAVQLQVNFSQVIILYRKRKHAREKYLLSLGGVWWKFEFSKIFNIWPLAEVWKYELFSYFSSWKIIQNRPFQEKVPLFVKGKYMQDFLNFYKKHYLRKLTCNCFIAFHTGQRSVTFWSQVSRNALGMAQNVWKTFKSFQKFLMQKFVKWFDHNLKSV